MSSFTFCTKGCWRSRYRAEADHQSPALFCCWPDSFMEVQDARTHFSCVEILFPTGRYRHGGSRCCRDYHQECVSPHRGPCMRFAQLTRQRICSCLWCRLCLGHVSRIAIQGRIIHVPNRQTRIFPPGISFKTSSRPSERSFRRTAHRGTRIKVLYSSDSRPRLSESVSQCHDCVQYLLFDLFGESREVQGYGQVWVYRVESGGRLVRIVEGLSYR